MTSLGRPGSPGSWSPDLKRPRWLGLSVWGRVRWTDKNSMEVGVSHATGTGSFHAGGLPITGWVSALPEEGGSDPASCWWPRRKEKQQLSPQIIFPSILPALLLCPLTSPACLKQKRQNTFPPSGGYSLHLPHHPLSSSCPEKSEFDKGKQE